MQPSPEDWLRRELIALAPIPEPEWRAFWPQVRERHFAAGQHLFREGEAALDVHFILSGIARLYHLSDGAERVRGFDYEGRFVAVCEALLLQQTSSLNVDALEPLHTLTFPGGLLHELYERHPCWDRIGRRVLEHQWLRHQDKEQRFRMYSPEAHYRLLIERDSPLLHRIPLRQLASYLRVTPETLSRIRTRIRASSVALGTVGRSTRET